MTDLFEASGIHPPDAPLADRLRPQALDQVVGQDHLLGPEGTLSRMLARGSLASLILWGPPGVGKTTIASILSQQTQRRFVEVSAVAAGVKEVRAVIDVARRRLIGDGKNGGQQTVLFIDEVHRFSKTQVAGPATLNRRRYRGCS